MDRPGTVQARRRGISRWPSGVAVGVCDMVQMNTKEVPRDRGETEAFAEEDIEVVRGPGTEGVGGVGEVLDGFCCGAWNNYQVDGGG
ncbi:hypothetical protein RUND412_010043 [Rhizina undulata]